MIFLNLILNIVFIFLIPNEDRGDPIVFLFFLSGIFIFYTYRSSVIVSDRIWKGKKTKKLVLKHFKNKISRIEYQFSVDKKIEKEEVVTLLMAYNKLNLYREKPILPLKIKKYVGNITGLAGLISGISVLLTYIFNILM